MDKIQEIQEALENCGIGYDSVNEHAQSIDIIVEGDWKHSHQYCDQVMKSLGYEKAYEIKSQADPNIIYDDWYISTHYYRKPE